MTDRRIIHITGAARTGTTTLGLALRILMSESGIVSLVPASKIPPPIPPLESDVGNYR